MTSADLNTPAPILAATVNASFSAIARGLVDGAQMACTADGPFAAIIAAISSALVTITASATPD